jgi:hypothetical protein
MNEFCEVFQVHVATTPVAGSDPVLQTRTPTGKTSGPVLTLFESSPIRSQVTGVTVSAAVPDAFGEGATPLSHAVRAMARRRPRIVRERMRERAVRGVAARIGRLSPITATEVADTFPRSGEVRDQTPAYRPAHPVLRLGGAKAARFDLPRSGRRGDAFAILAGQPDREARRRSFASS